MCEPPAAMLKILNIMKFTCDRLNWKKWPHPRALRPLDGSFASSEARLLTDIDASFDNFYKPTGDAC
jgi:hypothetical protein